MEKIAELSAKVMSPFQIILVIEEEVSDLASYNDVNTWVNVIDILFRREKDPIISTIQYLG